MTQNSIPKCLDTLPGICYTPYVPARCERSSVLITQPKTRRLTRDARRRMASAPVQAGSVYPAKGLPRQGVTLREREGTRPGIDPLERESATRRPARG